MSRLITLPVLLKPVLIVRRWAQSTSAVMISVAAPNERDAEPSACNRREYVSTLSDRLCVNRHLDLRELPDEDPRAEEVRDQALLARPRERTLSLHKLKHGH